jgi:peptidoglycan LD-endopeptidase CwlK
MALYGSKSKEKLASCHPDLQQLVNKVAEQFDLAVTCGHRGQKEQDAAVRLGVSKAPWPTSKHNSTPSMAVDLAPIQLEGASFKIEWNDLKSFRTLATLMKEEATKQGIGLKWGGDFKSFKDYPHFELT